MRDKKLLDEAFVKLRILGYFAEQNWKCCQSCGWAAIPDHCAKKAVFYHAQDADAIKKGMIDKKGLYIAWDGNGKEIVQVFNSVGLKTSWEGSKDTRILILSQKENCA